MDPLAPLITALHNEGRLRVWSMVITVFGDLVQHRGGQISTARLGVILGRVGVERGALRTALSRLGRDGWVESKRKGRASHYRLSPQGLARFAPATTRIYAAPKTGPVTRWTFSLRVGVSGRQEITLKPAHEAGEEADCQVTGELQQISNAYRTLLLNREHRSALAALAADIEALGDGALSSTLDAAAARVLLIHRWRRIVLRYPDIPAELMPPDCPLADPRGMVARAYWQVTEATEAWLDSDFSDFSAMSPMDASLPMRFKSEQRG